MVKKSAMLMQVNNGVETPVAHASKTLILLKNFFADKKRSTSYYIWCGKNFYQYFQYMGKTVCLYLIINFGFNYFAEQTVTSINSERLQRYAIVLMTYQFDIKYTSSSANGLSRLSTKVDKEFDYFESIENQEIIRNIEETIEGLPIDEDFIRTETLKTLLSERQRLICIGVFGSNKYCTLQ